MSTNLAELLRQADPVDLHDHAPTTGTHDDPFYLTILQRRDHIMSLDQKPTTTNTTSTPAHRRRGLLIAAAAFIAVLFVGVAVILTAQTTPEPPASPAPAPTNTVVVPGTEQWTDTGIDLSSDDTVLIEADGTVKPATYETSYGPDGAIDRPAAQEFNLEGLEEANHVALIGRIGEAGEPFEVGSELLFEADTEGRLFLGINDVDVANNVGEFTATITVNPS